MAVVGPPAGLPFVTAPGGTDAVSAMMPPPLLPPMSKSGVSAAALAQSRQGDDVALARALYLATAPETPPISEQELALSKASTVAKTGSPGLLDPLLPVGTDQRWSHPAQFIGVPQTPPSLSLSLGRPLPPPPPPPPQAFSKVPSMVPPPPPAVMASASLTSPCGGLASLLSSRLLKSIISAQNLTATSSAMPAMGAGMLRAHAPLAAPVAKPPQSLQGLPTVGGLQVLGPPRVVPPRSDILAETADQEESLPPDHDFEGWLELLRDGYLQQLRWSNSHPEPPPFHRAMGHMSTPGEPCPEGKYPGEALNLQLQLLLSARK
eukprot:TRINITY_DN17628_c1_g1_i1.p1 TRINITY_DN17628_c1_g1~~TRINITY_DN17628_c1_g1_i1.p1  ORF type:complete len:357 (+),score=60.85 TRINITY_DN17628_c1_g1_i1:110-1072(+)